MTRIPTNRAPTHPGEIILHEFLKPLGMTQYDAADKLGISRVRLNQIINARRGVTPDTALRLERLFGMSAQTWLNLQLARDLYEAMHSDVWREINKIRRLPQLERASA
jgi:addiction module HigA family antidote